MINIAEILRISLQHRRDARQSTPPSLSWGRRATVPYWPPALGGMGPADLLEREPPGPASLVSVTLSEAESIPVPSSSAAACFRRPEQ